uniref:adhesion G protein-coupled receptor L2-like n=1 Tax=Myxine glutinosa TaxID=7769 RepID=UPI0035902019
MAGSGPLLLALYVLLRESAVAVRAALPPGLVRRELACEGYALELRCPGSDVILVARANFGRTDARICDAEPDRMRNTHCWQPLAERMMAQRCNNRTQCVVVAGTDVFPDPCPGTYKFLEVQYECVPYIFLCPGTLRVVSLGQHLFESDQQAGSWCKDPLQATDRVYYMPWTPYRTDSITEFATLEDFIAGRPATTYKLPHRVDGTGFVVYDGATFFNKERTRNVVRYDLRSRVKSGEAVIPAANYHDTSPYRWGGKSDLDLAVDENGLWVIYATEQNAGRLVVSRLNPYTLRVEGTWTTGYDKRSASNAFVACGVLYVIRSVYEDDESGDNGAGENRIEYAYDTTKEKGVWISVPFPNPYRYIASVAYNPRDTALYVWNNFHILRYGLEFSPILETADPTLTPLLHNIPEFISHKPQSLPSPLPSEGELSLTSLPAGPEHGTRLPCPPEERRQIYWPQTPQGRIAKMPCPAGTLGTVIYQCLLGAGHWAPRGPDFSNCTSQWVIDITRKIKLGKNAADLAGELAQWTRSPVAGGDVAAAMRLLQELLDVLDAQLQRLRPGSRDPATYSLGKLQKRDSLCRVYIKAMVETVNNLLQPTSLPSWRDLHVSERSRTATALLDTMQAGAFILADNLLQPDNISIAAENLALTVSVLNTEGPVRDFIFPQGRPSGDAIRLSAKVIKRNSRNGLTKLVFALYNKLPMFLPTTNATLTFALPPVGHNHSVVVASRIISASINKGTRRLYLSEPVTFTLRHNLSNGNFNPNCSFWSYSPVTMAGRWATRDCKLLDSNLTHSTCSCHHLTNFAILAAHTEPQANHVQGILLLLIARAGVLVSVLCLALALLTFCCCRSLQSGTITVLKNLCLCLLLAELLFLLAIDRTQQTILCAVAAVLLHLLLLSSFSWCCLESLQLLRSLYSSSMGGLSHPRCLYTLGYGIPVLVVSASLATNYRGYGTETACWLNPGGHFLWSFLGPACLFALMNAAFLAVALFKTIFLSAPLKLETSRVNHARSLLFGATALLCLLAFTWTFGILFILQALPIRAYLFTAFNSLLGSFILVFHCLLQKEVRMEFSRCLRHLECGSWSSGNLGSNKNFNSRSTRVHSPNSQSRIRRMWNDTVRKQTESAFISGEPHSSGGLHPVLIGNSQLLTNSIMRPHEDQDFCANHHHPEPPLVVPSSASQPPVVPGDASSMATLPLPTSCCGPVGGNQSSRRDCTPERLHMKQFPLMTASQLPHDQTRSLFCNGSTLRRNQDELSEGQRRALVYVGGDPETLGLNSFETLEPRMHFPRNQLVYVGKPSGQGLGDSARVGKQQPPNNDDQFKHCSHTPVPELAWGSVAAKLAPERFPSLCGRRCEVDEQPAPAFFPLLSPDEVAEIQRPQQDSLGASLPDLRDSQPTGRDLYESREQASGLCRSPSDVCAHTLPHVPQSWIREQSVNGEQGVTGEHLILGESSESELSEVELSCTGQAWQGRENERLTPEEDGWSRVSEGSGWEGTRPQLVTNL